MARITDSKGRDDENSGYTRLLGVAELGQLLSRIHATVIRNGNELEAMLAQRCPHRATGLAGRLRGVMSLFPQAVEVYFGEALHISEGDHQVTADVTIVDNAARLVHVVELKDGDAFDTKKADGELASLRPLALALGQRLGYEGAYSFCCFNQEDRQAIIRGVKGRFGEANVLTGRELCGLLAVDYDQIRRVREEDVRANLEFFVGEVSGIPALREALLYHLGYGTVPGT